MSRFSAPRTTDLLHQLTPCLLQIEDQKDLSEIVLSFLNGRRYEESLNRSLQLTWHRAIVVGHLDVAQLLYRVLPSVISTDQIVFGPSIPSYGFLDACKHNHLPIARWLKATFPDLNHRVYDDEPMEWAKKHQNEEMIQFLSSL